MTKKTQENMLDTGASPNHAETREVGHVAGQRVRYQGRIYRILSVKLGGIEGPHYRLSAEGDYPNEDLTSHVLVTPVSD